MNKENDKPTNPDNPDTGGQPVEIEEKFELSSEAQTALASEVAEKMFEMTEKKKEEDERIISKNLGGDAPKPADEPNSPQGDESKEALLVKGIRALMNGDRAELKSINEKTLSELRTKAPFGNVATPADGGYLVPPADFIADVARLEEQYGVAIRDARVIRTNNNTVILNKKGSGVTMFEMTLGVGKGESQQKTGTKMTFAQDSVTLRKFAAIAAVTDELLEDAAVNIYNELTQDFARETARWQDRLVFVDSSTGIVNQAGIVSIASGTVLDQMVGATWQVPTSSANGGKFYISRSRFGGLLQAKDTTGRYILTPGPGTGGGTSGTTLWGYPYEVVEVLEEYGARNTVIFGNLKYVVLLIKNGLQLKTLSEATVRDADGNAVNLAERDMTALRAVVRMNARVQFPQAFAVLTAGTVS